MTLKQGDAVLIRAKIVSVDGNQATVSLSSTDFAIVPLDAIDGEHSYFCQCAACELRRKHQSDMEPYRTPEKNVPRGGKE